MKCNVYFALWIELCNRYIHKSNTKSLANKRDMPIKAYTFIFDMEWMRWDGLFDSQTLSSEPQQLAYDDIHSHKNIRPHDTIMRCVSWISLERNFAITYHNAQSDACDNDLKRSVPVAVVDCICTFYRFKLYAGALPALLWSTHICNSRQDGRRSIETLGHWRCCIVNNYCRLLSPPLSLSLSVRCYVITCIRMRCARLACKSRHSYSCAFHL